MVDGECFWPEKVSVGEVVYPPGGTFGPRQQRNLQLVMVRSGHLTVWIDGMPRTATANTVGVLFPGHEERFAFAEESETWYSWLHVFRPQFPETLLHRLNQLPWPLPLSPAMSDLTREALALRQSPLPTATELLKSLAVQMLWRYIGEGELQMNGTTAPLDLAVEHARRFISVHLTEPLTLDTIAAAAAVSPAHLIRLLSQWGSSCFCRPGWGWERLPIAAGFRRVSIFHDESARPQVLLLLRCESSLGKAAELEPCILFTPTLSFFL